MNKQESKTSLEIFMDDLKDKSLLSSENDEDEETEFEMSAIKKSKAKFAS